MNFFIPTVKFPRGPGKVSSCQIPFFSLTHMLSLRSEIQAAQGNSEAQPRIVHLSVSSIPNTCVKRALSRMRP